jgi:hypothetical protein
VEYLFFLALVVMSTRESSCTCRASDGVVAMLHQVGVVRVLCLGRHPRRPSKRQDPCAPPPRIYLSDLD